jgi:hypothetical protein
LLIGLVPYLPSGPQPADAAAGPVLVSADYLRTRPTSGAAWLGLKETADQPIGWISVADQDSNADIHTLAKALVYARTGTDSYRQAVVAALKTAVGTERGGTTLALGRNMAGFVIAADLVSLRTADPAFDTDRFRPWLRTVLSESLDSRTLTSTHEDRPNNWGTHAGASRVAIAAYLGDSAVLARAAAVFHGYIGSRASYAGFKFGDLSWQCNTAAPVGINPSCTKSGVDIGGAIPDDMRRGGVFHWPPTATGYPWEALQGALLQAELLRVAGYDSWNWENKALLRAARFLYDRAKWPAQGDDEWQTWLLDARYGTSYKLSSPVRFGKNFGFTDWIYGAAGGGTPAATPPPTPPPTATPNPTATPGVTPAPTPRPTSTPSPDPEPTSTPPPDTTGGGSGDVSARSVVTSLVTATSVSLTTVPVQVSWSLDGSASDLKRFEVQKSVDGGSYAAFASTTLTRLVTSLAPGHSYRFRVRGVNDAGDASSWSTAKDVALARPQQTAASYSGSGWVTAGSTSYIGSSAKATPSSTGRISFTFKGTSVSWIGPVGPTRGRAYVYLDGKYIRTVDTYKSTFVARRVLYAAYVPNGTHTLLIRVLGTAGHPWIAADAFGVITPN